MENIWAIVFLIFAGQGIFLSLFLFANRSSFSKSNKFLAVLFLLFSLNLIENVSYWTNYILEVPHIANSTAGFVYLYGPLFYFFTLTRVHLKYRFKWLDLFHLIPFIVITIRLLEYYLLPESHKLYTLTHQGEFSSFIDYVNQMITVMSIIMYGFLSRRAFNKSDVKSALMKNVILSFLVFGSTYALYFIIINVVSTGVYFDFVVTLVLCFLVYQTGYYALMYPDFFDPTYHKKKSEIKYLKSNLSETDSKQYLSEIRNIMVKEKLYLNRNLKTQDLSERMGISTNYISQTLNQHANMSFIEYVNKYRIEEAKKLLTLEKFNSYTIEAIAMESGFNNKTSFNKYFKEFTSLTPKEFKRDRC